MAIEVESTTDERRSDDAIEELLRERRARQQRTPSSDIVKQLIGKYGSRDRAIEELVLENYKLREKLREIRRGGMESL